MNKSVTPPRKQRSVISTSPGARSLTPRASHQRGALSEALAQQKLRNNRERLVHTLDTFTMLIRSNNPMRCLQHNSVISVYCETDNRLLCSNCIFGKSEHKYHKVVPVDRSQPKIEEQVNLMSSQVQRQCRVIGEIADFIVDNLVNQEAELHKTLNALTIRYRQAQRLLEQSFTTSRDRLILKMRDLRIRHEAVSLQLQLLKDVYRQHCGGQNEQNEEKDLQDVLYRHAVLQAISNLKKFESHTPMHINPVFQDIGKAEISKIALICDELLQNLKQGTAF